MSALATLGAKITKHNISGHEFKIVSSVKAYITNLKKRLNDYCEENEIPNFPIQLHNVNAEVSKACGVSIHTVKCSKRKTENNPNNGKENCTKINPPGRKRIICDSFSIASIRQVCHRFYANKEYPTAAKIRMKCLENVHFPRVGLKVFRKWLKNECKFKYKKIFKKPVYLERTDIVAQRDYYLRHKIFPHQTK